MLKSQRWQKTAMAAAAAAFLSLWAANSAALSLGRITVQSALGEPLQAEIDIPDINPEESASLKSAVAQPEAFKAAGLDYNPAMANLRVTLQRRADGRAYIQLRSDRPINDPFVDLILETSWASGRIVRDYTMLFDPPSLKPAAAAASPLFVPAQSTAAQTPPPSAPAPAVAARATPAAAAVQRTGQGTPAPLSKPSAAAAQPGAKATAAARSAQPLATQVKVKTGDTASKIANTVKPASVSLDQMLVALLRANPDAFVNGNINRIKAGAVVDVPSDDQVQATSAREASQLIVAQSKDFNAFRRRLATGAPVTDVASANRRASGAVQAKVEEKKPTPPAPDKLTLSKGAVKGKVAEDLIAKDRSAKEAASRAAELTKNISDLNKLGATPKAAASAPASAVSAAKGAVVPLTVATPTKPAASAPTPPVAPAIAAKPAASAPVAMASAPVSASSMPAKTVSAPVAAAATQPASAAAPAPVAKPSAAASPTPQPQPEPSLIDELLDNPIAVVVAGALGLVALLGGFGLYRLRKRKNAAQVDSSFLESRLQPDSFFGASGGQRVDTSNSSISGSSMVYSPSQLDAADDVDPVAEADVYLAYGRDLQAEEILREALRINPGRIAIQTKLLEIYAKRRDAKAFEAVANQSYKLTSGDGPDWVRICDMGLGIDPSNPLYQPGGKPASMGSPSQPAPLESAAGFAASTVPQPSPEDANAPAVDVDLDFDLDFSLDDIAPAAAPEPTSKLPAYPAPGGVEPTIAIQAAKLSAPALDLSFGMGTAPLPTFDAPVAPAATLPELSDPDQGLSFDLDIGDLPAAKAVSGTAAATPAPANDGMLEFDLGSLSLDLDSAVEPVAAPAAAVASLPEDPLATKLALADEFNAIGDSDGARALIEEVLEEATGDMKARAQRALSHL